MNQIATQTTVTDLIDEYHERSDGIVAAIEAYDRSVDAINMAATVHGVYVERVVSRPHLSAKTLQANILKSAWRAVYNRLNIDAMATAKDKKLFERMLSDPPALTFSTVVETFGDYYLRPRHHVLRGLAEVFCDLDAAYRSHSKVKIGVAGLPKRIIVSHVGGWGSYGRAKIGDVVGALAAYRGQPIVEHTEFNDLDRLHWGGEHRAGEVNFRGLTIKKYMNGNAHIIFDRDALTEINLALAEFYGEVLPDVEPEGATPQASTAVSKDLQFYWSPRSVAEAACEYAGIYGPRDYSGSGAAQRRVLEPSCGDGRILDELRARVCRAFGIEYHEGRAAQARAKGHNVLTANFLEQPPVAEFDFVVMNPPFYGRHYIKHVEHALKFLKPGGTLVAVLPATAHYDHKVLKGDWKDLPVGSFSEAGTNVPTGLLRIRVPGDVR